MSPVSRSSAVPSQIEDVQGRPDHRRIAIDRVGIREITHPIRVEDRSGGVQHTIATVSMSVQLPHHLKGTHMSRFVEVLNDQDRAITADSFRSMLSVMVERLEAESGHIEMSFPFFIEKRAPVSGIRSFLDYRVRFLGEIRGGESRVDLELVVPVTSLCPCSKEISSYGAHNQRSHITVTVSPCEPVSIEELVELVEQEASCELFGLLKRSDEKFVTERAYDNPKFVEDLVRDVEACRDADDRVRFYAVESENFESIHNHSAYAVVTRDKDSASL